MHKFVSDREFICSRNQKIIALAKAQNRNCANSKFIKVIFIQNIEAIQFTTGKIQVRKSLQRFEKIDYCFSLVVPLTFMQTLV